MAPCLFILAVHRWDIRATQRLSGMCIDLHTGKDVHATVRGEIVYFSGLYLCETNGFSNIYAQF